MHTQTIANLSRVWLCALPLVAVGAKAQINVLTAHNDIARTGQNLQETTLTPANINPTQFGKLFSHTVNGPVFGQPLYVSGVTIPGAGVHNVIYVTTTTGNPNGTFGQFAGDTVYAFDADTNGGANANPLWQVSLLTNTAPAGTYSSEFGILGTPVIDQTAQIMYVVSSELLGGAEVYRLHALDIRTGAEKLGGPVTIDGSVSGTGEGSVGGVMTFSQVYSLQRPALLLLNGIVYIAFGSHSDVGPWHGWVFSYNATTLQQIDIFCTSPNGEGGGIWMGGSGLAAEVYSAAKPYGRLFFSTGNGSYSASYPYTKAMNYGMSILDLDLTGGMMTVEDEFTPFNEALLNSEDGDLGSGGPVLLPTQTLASGKTLNPLLQIGKSGTFYILDRDNNTDGSNNRATEYSPAGLGGFNTDSDDGDQVVQEVQTPVSAGAMSGWGAGVWGPEAYWNNNIYSGGTNPDLTNSLTAYSFVNGVLSTTPTSQSSAVFAYPGPKQSVSANGATNGIVWALKTDGYQSLGYEVLLAYDATNLANNLYSSNSNLARDNPGQPVEYAVPTIANGKVYVGASGDVSIYGLLNGTAYAPAPIISPSGRVPEPFTGSQTITITDAVTGAIIYYTTDGSTPTTSSPIYQSANPPVVYVNQTITAIASATGYLLSPPASVTYVSTSTPQNPVFSLASGIYSGTQTVTISDASPGAAIYYTTDGLTPTTASNLYTGPISIPISETVQAIAVQGQFSSPTVSANYTIQPGYNIDFSQGFTLAQLSGQMQFNGSTGLDDFRLQLTNGEKSEAGSAFFAQPVDIRQFTTDFTFQLSNPGADGITFTIQNVSPKALGGDGAGLGFVTIQNSLAIKFDIFNNGGEGSNSTGLFTWGNLPTVPAIDLTSSGINLRDGNFKNVHITYNGTTLSMTISDPLTLATFSTSWAINIPATVFGNTAWVGFTGATGGLTSSQKLTYWTYLAGPPLPNYGSGFAPGSMTLNGGAAFNGSRVRLTDGNTGESRSAFFATPVNFQQFVTSFDFQITNPVADGFTFTIQASAAGPTAKGHSGAGLGYSGIPDSVAVKFDLFSNAGEGADSTGLYINGTTPTVPAIDLSSTGINLHSGDIFNAQLAYNGVTLTVVITDTVTNATATQTYTVNIPSIVESSTAYVGFTGGTGGSSAVVDILNWSYSPQPATGPSFFNGFSAAQSQLTLNNGAVLNGTRLRLTDNHISEARSAFFTTPVNVQQFATSFNFQITNPGADGFTFAVQGASPTAVGHSGQNLGYSGISKSVGVKFDMYSNAGEGADSTGLYTNGATPTLPAINLSTTGINLHSGDIFNAQLTYNGITLTVVITDTVTNATATQAYTVNIPSLVGGSTGYIGFTGATGGLTAVQEILSWNYSKDAAN